MFSTISMVLGIWNQQEGNRGSRSLNSSSACDVESDKESDYFQWLTRISRIQYRDNRDFFQAAIPKVCTEYHDTVMCDS